MRTLVKNGTVVNPAGESGALDILIEDSRIVAMETEITETAVDVDNVIDADGLVVAPGLVDVHVHFRDPGQTHKETIASGAEAAKHGGFTSVVMMANTVPPIDNVAVLSDVISRGKQTGIHVYAVANITKGMEGKEVVNMEELVEAGAVGFSDDGKPIMDDFLVAAAMVRAKKLGVPLSFHEEDPKYIDSAGFNSSMAIMNGLGISGADRRAEWTMIQRDVEIAMTTGAEIDIQHISTREGVEIVSRARMKGYNNIHAEATPHHFTLTEEDAIKYKTLAKMNPPLRTRLDRDVIITGLHDDVIEMIASDHAPHTAEEKAKGLTEAPSGIIGLETSFALAITMLVKPGCLTLYNLISRMSVSPAAIYHLNAGVLSVGKPADIIVFDPDEKWVVPLEFASKSANCPFIGWELYGKIKYTIADGVIVYQE